jgi:hypothetical protein
MRQYLVLLSASLAALPTYGLPTMVRLGYTNCVSCHLTPQGGGLLNEYGRGIDEAQSLRAGDYVVNDKEPTSALTFGGHLDQDFRVMLSDAFTRKPGGDYSSAFRSRFYYRTVTTLSKGFRFTATAAGENEPSPRRNLKYDPAIVPSEAFLPTALVQYRPKDGIEVAVGRDQLPMGIYTGDLATLIRSRNRYGYYDTPLQAKVFFWSKRWQLVPYAFAPRGGSIDQVRERGGGVLAEYDLFGKGRTIVGLNVLRGLDSLEHRTLSGIYTRLGFGAWGILAEHDLTFRSQSSVAEYRRFNQSTSYVQVFRAFREWLVASAIVERLNVQTPFDERLLAGRGELVARLSPNFTLGARIGAQYDRVTGRAAPVFTVQMAWKTVHLKPW